MYMFRPVTMIDRLESEVVAEFHAGFEIFKLGADTIQITLVQKMHRIWTSKMANIFPKLIVIDAHSHSHRAAVTITGGACNPQ